MLKNYGYYLFKMQEKAVPHSGAMDIAYLGCRKMAVPYLRTMDIAYSGCRKMAVVFMYNLV